MNFESVCRQCKFCISEEIVNKGPSGEPALYGLACDEGSPNFQTQDGCWQFELAEEREDADPS